MSHTGDTAIVTREQLALAPVPPETATFKPVPHITLVMALETILADKGITVTREQYALRSDGSRMFGTFDLALAGAYEASAGALGFRTANNRSMSLQMVAGMRVFVCDNMALSGDMVVLKRKHTGGLDLMAELLGATERYLTRYTRLCGEVQDMMALGLTDSEAKAVIHDVFVKGVFPIRLMPQVSGLYFEPVHEEFAPRTAWSLHNAFSEVAKGMFLNRRLEAMQRVGQTFGLIGNGQQPDPMTLDMEQQAEVVEDAVAEANEQAAEQAAAEMAEIGEPEDFGFEPNPEANPEQERDRES